MCYDCGMKRSRRNSATYNAQRACLALLLLAAMAMSPFSLALAEGTGCGSGASPDACATCPNCQVEAQSEPSVQAASCCNVDLAEESDTATSGCCATEGGTGEQVTGHQCPCSLTVPEHPIQPVRHSVDQASNSKPTPTQLELLADLLPLQDARFVGVSAFAASIVTPSAPTLASLCCYRC